MSADHRLSAEQLAALAPGDTVTIETSYGDRRPRLHTGTVVSTGPEIFVSTRGRGGTKFVERYRRRDGLRISGGNTAQLVRADVDDPAARDLLRRRTGQIDAAYRAWSRHRADVEALRQLQQAIEEYLAAEVTAPTGLSSYASTVRRRRGPARRAYPEPSKKVLCRPPGGHRVHTGTEAGRTRCLGPPSEST